MWKAITHRKPLSAIKSTPLHPSLTLGHLVAIGIGCVIGAGIFSITGVAAAEYSGPGLCFSFLISAVGCFFTGISFAELSAALPTVGSAYLYSYVFLGEGVAWTVGVCLIMENLFAAAAVAVGFSSAFVQLLYDAFGVQLPSSVASPFFIVTDDDDLAINPTFSINIVAVLLIAGLSFVLSFGARESASMTTAAVVVKVGVLVALIAYGLHYMIAHPDQFAANHTPFIPPADPSRFGKFGIWGLFRGAAATFFAYIGFDCICAMAAEAKNPRKDIPNALGLTLGICTVLYVLVTYFLTGLVNYKQLNVASPVTFALQQVGAPRAYLVLVDLGAVAGLLSVSAVCLLGQSRIIFAMAIDGMFPQSFTIVDETFKVPRVAIAYCGIVGCLIAALLPIDTIGTLVSFGTLCAFCAVQVALIKKRQDFPDMASPFQVPHVSFPYIGIFTCLVQLFFLPLPTLRNFAVVLALSYVFYFFYRLQSLSEAVLKKWEKDQEEIAEIQKKQHEEHEI